MRIDTVAKSVVAGCTTATSTLIAAAEGGITGTEWAVIVLGTLGAAAAVWATPNAPADTPEHDDTLRA